MKKILILTASFFSFQTLTAQIIDILLPIKENIVTETQFTQEDKFYSFTSNMIRNKSTNTLFYAASGTYNGNGYFIEMTEGSPALPVVKSAKYKASPKMLVPIDEEKFLLVSSQSIALYKYDDYSYIDGNWAPKGDDGALKFEYQNAYYDADNDLIYYYVKRRASQSIAMGIVDANLKSKSDSWCASSMPVSDFFAIHNSKYISLVGEVSSQTEFHEIRKEKDKLSDAGYNSRHNHINVELMEHGGVDKFCNWANTDFEIDIDQIINDRCRGAIKAKKNFANTNITKSFRTASLTGSYSYLWKIANAFYKGDDVLSIAVAYENQISSKLNKNFVYEYKNNKGLCFIDIDIPASIEAKKAIIKNVIEFMPSSGSKETVDLAYKDVSEESRGYDYLGFKVIPTGSSHNQIIVLDDMHGMYTLHDGDVLENSDGTNGDKAQEGSGNQYYASGVVINSKYIKANSNYNKPYHYFTYFLDADSEKGSNSDLPKGTFIFTESQGGKQAICYQIVD